MNNTVPKQYINITIEESAPGSGKTFSAIQKAVRTKGKYPMRSIRNGGTANLASAAKVAKKTEHRPRKATRMQRSIRRLNQQTADARRLQEWRASLVQRAQASQTTKI